LAEEFSDWSPEFSSQTSSFEQTRTGTKGTEEKRTIDVSINSNVNETFEGIENIDINQDGDNYDFYNANLTTYTASEDLGFHKAVNNYFNKINQNISEWRFSMDWSNPTAENSIPCPIPYQWTDWNGQERGLINRPEDVKCKFN